MNTFHLGDLLSVTADVLVAPTGMDGIYRLLNHMTGDNLFTHQLPRASDECKPALLAQFPFLTDIKAPDFRDEAHVWSWLAEQVDIYGTGFEVKPLDPVDHTRIDPITELGTLMPGKPVIVISEAEC